MSFQYLNIVKSLLSDLEKNERNNISASICLLVETIKNKRQIFAFGASHAGILSQEMFYRAGGLSVINPVFEPSIMLDLRPVTMTSQMERLEGYGKIIGQNTKIKSNDVVIIHSVSGRNPVAIDFALYCKSIGAKIIAITNVSYSQSVTSRHSSSKRLFEIADIVIDNQGEKGDACVKVEGLPQKVAPTSTVIGATIVNIIISETVIELQKQGVKPPVFFSANVDGGDENNKAILEEYKDIIHYQ